MLPSAETASRSKWAVEYHGITKAYDGTQVLDGFNLKIPTGQRVALIGRSGSGKTTLLRILMTIEVPDDGEIVVEGERLEWTRRRGKPHWAGDADFLRIRGKIGMVFQHFNLFPHMTVLQNIVEAPVQVRRMERAKAEAEAMDLLRMVGLESKASAWPRQLSGGQQQRVAIARALAMRPHIMLFDEITSALDPEMVAEVLKTVRRIADDSGMTMLLVTHEMNFAREFADRVIFMEGGRIVEDDAPARIFGAPADPRTRSFLQSVLSA